MKTNHRSRVSGLSSVSACIGIGAVLGLATAVFAQSGGGFPIRLCKFCYDYSDTITICDTIVCFGGSGCGGQMCVANNGFTVRACCGTCPDDDWLDTCDEPQ